MDHVLRIRFARADGLRQWAVTVEADGEHDYVVPERADMFEQMIVATFVEEDGLSVDVQGFCRGKGLLLRVVLYIEYQEQPSLRGFQILGKRRNLLGGHRSLSAAPAAPQVQGLELGQLHFRNEAVTVCGPVDRLVMHDDGDAVLGMSYVKLHAID